MGYASPTNYYEKQRIMHTVPIPESCTRKRGRGGWRKGPGGLTAARCDGNVAKPSAKKHINMTSRGLQTMDTKKHSREMTT